MQEGPAEADREAQDFEAELARHDEMAELVRRDQDADRDDEPQNSLEYRKSIRVGTAGPLATRSFGSVF